MVTECVLVLRDVRERGRDIEGIIKQWFNYVKPSYTKYVEPQRSISGGHRLLDTVTLTHLISSQTLSSPAALKTKPPLVKFAAVATLRLPILMSSDMVVQHIRRKLQEKSELHTNTLRRLGLLAAKVELPANVHVLPSNPQLVGMNTILQNPETEQVDFVFYFDRLASILIETYVSFFRFSCTLLTINDIGRWT